MSPNHKFDSILTIWVTLSSSGSGLYTCNCTSQTSRATRQKSTTKAQQLQHSLQLKEIISSAH